MERSSDVTFCKGYWVYLKYCSWSMPCRVWFGCLKEAKSCCERFVLGMHQSYYIVDASNERCIVEYVRDERPEKWEVG